MWPFSLFNELRNLRLVVATQKAHIWFVESRVRELTTVYDTRGEIIVTLREKIFALQSDVLTASEVLKVTRDAFSEIADHGTQFPNGTVQRMARIATAAAERLDAALQPKAKSSAAEEMVKAA